MIGLHDHHRAHILRASQGLLKKPSPRSCRDTIGTRASLAIDIVKLFPMNHCYSGASGEAASAQRSVSIALAAGRHVLPTSSKLEIDRSAEARHAGNAPDHRPEKNPSLPTLIMLVLGRELDRWTSILTVNPLMPPARRTVSVNLSSTMTAQCSPYRRR
jgi:hypothetical protein